PPPGGGSDYHTASTPTSPCRVRCPSAPFRSIRGRGKEYRLAADRGGDDPARYATGRAGMHPDEAVGARRIVEDVDGGPVREQGEGPGRAGRPLAQVGPGKSGRRSRGPAK